MDGPLDRVSFLAEQTRNRRVSWVFGAGTLLAIIATAIPLGTVAAPLLYMAVIPIGIVGSMIHPHSGWPLLLIVPAAIFPMLFGLAFSPSNFHYTTPHGVGVVHSLWPAVIATLIFAVLPGIACFSLVWHVVHNVLRQAGADAILERLGSRRPNLADLEEKQLVDVVEEIAVAAGLRAPRVEIIDGNKAGGAANAGAVGWSIDDVTIVVTRPLLDNLTREQTQSVIARVIASIGNGDLGIAYAMLTLFQSVRVVQFAKVGVLWQCLRSPDREAATALLAVRDHPAVHETRTSALGCLFAPLLFPLRFSAWTIGVIISASEYLLTGPLVDATWRRRELLSDATAVRLTRDPDGLASALGRLREVDVRLPNAEVVSYLFAVWWTEKPAGALFSRRPHATIEHRLAQLAAMGAHVEVRPGAESEAPASEMAAGILAFIFGQVVWAMMTVALFLMTAELFAMGVLGFWLVTRFGSR